MPLHLLPPVLYEVELCGWPLYVGIALLAILSFWADAHRSRKEARRYLAVRDFAVAHNFRFMGDQPCPKPDAPQFALGNRQATQNTILATLQGREVQMGDYNYQRETQGKDGHRHVSNYYFSYCFVPLPETAFPDLALRPELAFDKALAVAGFDDIDFESHEFSRRFHVQSSHRKFAYDMITPSMMEYLLQYPQYGVQWCRAGVVVLFAGNSRCPVADLLPAAYFVVGLLEFIPAHLWASCRTPPPGLLPPPSPG